MLWTRDALVAACSGRFEEAADISPQDVTGVSIDTRAIQAGDLFVALKDVRDGHEFVSQAFAKGAAAALVSSTYIKQPGDGALIRVADPLHGDDPLNALIAIGVAARARLADTARVIAVTGSAGKTGTKEMLRVCLETCGKVHASEKSYNNHWGVPLTLARMPADTEFGVFEIGMNHAGEITPLSKMVRPHITIITNVLPVHLGHFNSEADIAKAKAEIFVGLEAGGTAILLKDSTHFHGLQAAALVKGTTVRTFGDFGDLREHEKNGTTPPDAGVEDEVGIYHLAAGYRSMFDVVVGGETSSPSYKVMHGMLGRHIAHNTAAVLLCLDELKLHSVNGRLRPETYKPLENLTALPGRGAMSDLTLPTGSKVLLIDEAYNANPASMAAALRVFGSVTSRNRFSRRIAVLGDMRELGDFSDQLHRDLAPAVVDAGVDLVFAAGPHMKVLYDALPKHLCGKWAQTSAELRDDLLKAISAGDAVMIKGSLGSRMGLLVEALRTHFGPGT
jgi:UDP-N-acetylmuramoyl-tripeptide--D-alanyl-D-alanine ligase